MPSHLHEISNYAFAKQANFAYFLEAFNFPVVFPHELCHSPVASPQENNCVPAAPQLAFLQSTLPAHPFFSASRRHHYPASGKEFLL